MGLRPSCRVLSESHWPLASGPPADPSPGRAGRSPQRRQPSPLRVELAARLRAARRPLSRSRWPLTSAPPAETSSESRWLPASAPARRILSRSHWPPTAAHPPSPLPVALAARLTAAFRVLTARPARRRAPSERAARRSPYLAHDRVRLRHGRHVPDAVPRGHRERERAGRAGVELAAGRLLALAGHQAGRTPSSAPGRGRCSGRPRSCRPCRTSRWPAPVRVTFGAVPSTMYGTISVAVLPATSVACTVN